MNIKRSILAVWLLISIVSLLVNIAFLAGDGVTVTQSQNTTVSQEQKQEQSMLSIIITASDIKYNGGTVDMCRYVKVNNIEEYVAAYRALGSVSIFSHPVYFPVVKTWDFILFKRSRIVGFDTYLAYPLVSKE